jgi:hypothetical protein
MVVTMDDTSRHFRGTHRCAGKAQASAAAIVLKTDLSQLRKMMKNVSNYQWCRAISGIGLAAAVMAGCASVPAPTEQIAVSKAAVANAVDAGGPEFASAEMRTAQEKLDRANQAMAAQDYERARWLAEQAQVDAQLAAAKARSAKAQKAAYALQEDSRVLREELNRKSK